MGAGWRTLAYTLVVVTLEFALGLGMALLFTTLGRKSEVWRTVFLYPLMIAPIVAGLLWKFLMIDNFGLIGTLLHQAGILQNPNQIGWLSNPDIVLFSVAVPDIWLTTSFMCLVLFAGLQNIPGDLIEAARLDGAKAPTLLFRIILPLLRPVIAVALVVRGIDAARAFDTILIQTNGGPQSASETMSLLIYRTMIRFGDPGLASAMGTIYLLAMLGVAFFAVATIWRPGKDN
jgi:multiple sugar transport system permease protein